VNYRFSFFRKLLVLVLFGLVPLLAMHFTLSKIIDFHYEKKSHAFIDGFKAEVLSLARQTSADFFYFKLVDRLFAKIRNNSSEAAGIIEKFQKDFKSRLINHSNLYLFNSSGQLDQNTVTRQPNRHIIGKVWQQLISNKKLSARDDKSLQKKLQLLFGAECSIGYLKIREGQLIELRKKGRRGYLFWKRFSPDEPSGILVYHLPSAKTLEILRAYGKEFPISFSFWPKNELQPAFENSDNIADGIFIKKLLENQMTDFCSYRQRYWFITRTSEGSYLASISMPDARLTQSKRGLVNLVFLLAGTIFSSFLFIPRFNLQTVFISIRTKLIGLVLIAIAIPSFGFIYTGILSIADREGVLLSGIENQQRQFLSAIEDEFALEEKKFEKDCDSLFELIANNYNPDSFEKISRSFMKSGKAIRLETRRIDGEVLDLLSREGYFDGLEKTHDAFSRHSIRIHLEKRLKNENVVLQKLPDSAMTGIFENSDSGFSQILEAPGRAHRIKFGDNELLWYCRFIETSAHPIALLTVFQARDLSRKNFLLDFVKKHPEKAMKLGVFNFANRTWLKEPPTQVKSAEKLIEQAILEEKTVTKIMSDLSGRFIAVAMPGMLLAPFHVVYLSRDNLILDETRKLGILLTLGNCLILLITLVVAQLISQTFLIPIKEINRGLEAMQKRLPEAKVAITNKDELGELGIAFNQMIDDLQEMQLAKIVQDSLFPAKDVRIPGYDLSIFNHTATELGGDYCDVLPFSADQWLILIGDVSGHGTPAAMAMAMVKAAIFQACRDHVPFELLPEKISNMMMKNLKKKKMMTMLFILLNNKTHQVNIINAGHNWPIILEKDKGFEEIKLIGMPLGIRRNAVSRGSTTMTIKAGDSLFAYTDALIEGTNASEEPFGFDRLHQNIQKNSSLAPGALIKALESSWKQHLGTNKQEDDLTMLALKRRTEPE